MISKGNRESEAATPASECSLPSLVSSSNKVRNLKKKPRTPSPPLTPLVEQITEMGFSKRGVEFAIRALSKLNIFFFLSFREQNKLLCMRKN